MISSEFFTDTAVTLVNKFSGSESEVTAPSRGFQFSNCSKIPPQNSLSADREANRRRHRGDSREDTVGSTGLGSEQSHEGRFAPVTLR